MAATVEAQLRSPAASRSPLAQRATSMRAPIVVELHGADFALLVPLAEAHGLPAMTELLRRGSLVEIDPADAPNVAAAWTSLRTGQSVVSHGVLDSLRFGRGGLTLQTQGWSPPNVMRHLAPVATDECRGVWRRPPRDAAEVAAGAGQIAAALARLEDTIRIGAAFDDPAIYSIAALRSVAAVLWHCLGIEEAGAAAPWRRPVAEALRAVDRVLAVAIETAIRYHRPLVVVSAGGTGRFCGAIGAGEILCREGLLVERSTLARIGLRAAAEVHRWRRRAGRWCRWAAPPRVGLDWVDWRRTRALPVHGDEAAMIYLARPERFGRGSVTTQAEQREATGRAIAALTDARHPVDGRPLFEDVYATAERFHDDPLARQWPDVVAVAARGFRVRHTLHHGGHLVRTEPARRATDVRGGMLIVYGGAALPPTGAARSLTAEEAHAAVFLQPQHRRTARAADQPPHLQHA